MTTAPATLDRSGLSLAQPRLRRDLFIGLIVVAVLSPNIGMPGGLPAIRLEQLMLAAMLPSLALLHIRHREFRRLTAIDGVFLVLTLAITTSIIAAPLIVSSVDWSIRDPFEVARIVEYWLMYRFGMTLVVESSTSRSIVYVLLALTIALTVFSLLQYLDGAGAFNRNVTDIWAVSHNLVGVQREGRAIGTIGNANYYSFFMALPLIAGLSLILLKRLPEQRGLVLLVLMGVFAAVFSATLAQSRTGAAAIFFGMFWGLLLVILARRPSAPLRAIGFFLACLIIAVSFMQVQKPLVDSFNARFNPSRVDEDASLIIRIQRFRTFFTGFFSTTPSICEGDRLDARIIPDAKKPRPGALGNAAAPDVQARDRQRKADVATISAGVVEYFCAEDRWPVGAPAGELLVPEYLDVLPVDPLTGAEYPAYISPGGFTIGAELEDAADPDGPYYTVSTIPSIVVNSSFESSFGTAWVARNGAAVAHVAEGLFGSRAAALTIPPGGDVRQFVVFDFPLNEEYTMTVWARSQSGADESLVLYVIGQQLEGSRYDPLVRQTYTVPGTGEWTPLALSFRTPERGRITTLEFMLRAAEGGSGVAVDIDGASLTQGTFPQSFVHTSDVDPATLRPQDLPQFSDSPLIGVGPRNNAEAGAFDNEYVLFMDRYGILGSIPYLGMYAAAIWAAIAAFRRRHALMDVLGLTLFAFTMTLLLFNVGAGSYYHFAIMAVYWLLVGYISAAPRPTMAAAMPVEVPARTPGGVAPAASAVRAEQPAVRRG